MIEGLADAIKKEFQRQADDLFEAHKKALIEELDKKKAEYCAGIALHIMKQVSFDRIGDELRITVSTKEIS